jgi:putative intracellular protease/amidase
MKFLRYLCLAGFAALCAVPSYAANVLVVISGADHLDLRHGGSHPTGFYLNELMQPVLLLEAAGHTLTFATSDGRIPTLDKGSANARSFGGNEAALKTAQNRLDQLRLLSATDSPVISLARIEQIGVAHFDAVFVPGGHAPMQDLVTDAALGRILTAFHNAHKPTAAVCHGPAALLSAVPDAAAYAKALESGTAKIQPRWIYAGYRLTVLDDRVENQVKGMFGGDTMKFFPEDALKTAGAKFSQGSDPLAPYVVTDRELITGANPASASAVGQALVESLTKALPAPQVEK